MAIRKLLLIWRDTLTRLTGRTKTREVDQYFQLSGTHSEYHGFTFQAQWLRKCASSQELSCQSPWDSEKAHSPRLLASVGADTERGLLYPEAPGKAYSVECIATGNALINQGSSRIRSFKIEDKENSNF